MSDYLQNRFEEIKLLILQQNVQMPLYHFQQSDQKIISLRPLNKDNNNSQEVIHLSCRDLF